jgi:hypothetical protein
MDHLSYKQFLEYLAGTHENIKESLEKTWSVSGKRKKFYYTVKGRSDPHLYLYGTQKVESLSDLKYSLLYPGMYMTDRELEGLSDSKNRKIKSILSSYANVFADTLDLKNGAVYIGDITAFPNPIRYYPESYLDIRVPPLDSKEARGNQTDITDALLTNLEHVRKLENKLLSGKISSAGIKELAKVLRIKDLGHRESRKTDKYIILSVLSALEEDMCTRVRNVLNIK